MNETARRYDLDWLRVLVFGLLIFYHVGMFFVPWGWHFKNNETYTWLVYPMLFLNQWRLPILFVISGMGTYFALGKRSIWTFVKERFWRLWVPLGVGMFVVVPPQVYLERIVKGDFIRGYFEWWPMEAFIGIYPSGNMSWHHLWFLPYLLLFSWMLAPAFVYLKNNPGSLIQSFTQKLLSSPWLAYGFILPIYLAESLLEPFFPSTKALVGDWFTIGYYICFFFFGFLLMLNRDDFWALAEKHRNLFLINGIMGFIGLIGIRMIFEDSTIIHFTEALIKVFNVWSWILTLFGFAATYLNRPSKRLSYCNAAVYPFYILHQTITLTIGYFVMNLDWSLGVKSGIMVIGTFLGSWIIYEAFIRPWKWMRPVFGVK